MIQLRRGRSWPTCVFDLRHTFATLLGELGVAAGVIGALLGHVPSNITQHARATMAAMREAVKLLAAHYEKGK